jgi:hypothetical protein
MLLIVVFIVLLISGLVISQVQEKCVAKYNGTGDENSLREYLW